MKNETHLGSELDGDGSPLLVLDVQGSNGGLGVLAQTADINTLFDT